MIAPIPDRFMESKKFTQKRAAKRAKKASKETCQKDPAVLSLTTLARGALEEVYGTAAAEYILSDLATAAETLEVVRAAHRNDLVGCLPFASPPRATAWSREEPDYHIVGLAPSLVEFKRTRSNCAHGAVDWEVLDGRPLPDGRVRPGDIVARVRSLVYPEFSLDIRITRSEYNRTRSGETVFVGGKSTHSAARRNRCTGRVCSDHVYHQSLVQPAKCHPSHLYAKLYGDTVHVASLFIYPFWLNFNLHRGL